MTLKDRYWFGGFSGTPPSEPNLSTPPPPPGYSLGYGVNEYGKSGHWYIFTPFFQGLKPMYNLGKWWKLKVSLMGFVYRVVRVLKALWIFLSETINSLRKLHKTNIFGMPPKFYHRVMYKAPSSGHISLNFNMPFKLNLRRFEVVFWYLEWECCTFWKLDGNSFKSTNTILITMALIFTSYQRHWLHAGSCSSDYNAFNTKWAS